MVSQRRNGKRMDDQATGDELASGDLQSVIRAASTPDVIDVLTARAKGKKWSELSPYLTSQTGSSWDGRRVEASRARFRRQKGKLRIQALAGSKWKPRRVNGTVYRQRLPDGSEWRGKWTYCHIYTGDDLEVYREVMAHERRKLFVNK